MARKSEVYTWRLSSSLKASLEEAARTTNRSVASLLEEIVAERFEATRQLGAEESNQQRRLHVRAAGFAGRLSGTDPVRGENARARVRARLTKRRDRVR